ncbi:MAG: DUF4124 domain-containing protein [Pseudomonadota bacterium]|nr:DUF4124 domain-containing protein [Pseudomonadota bacterium]
MRLATAVALALALNAAAATVAEKAKESGCLRRPTQVEGSMFKCETGSGAWSYFNVPDLTGPVTPPPPRTGSGVAPVAAPRASNGFPRVDPETQKGRDDVRRRVLQDELATEEKLLSESRNAYADGAPVPLPEERTNTEKYRERIARLRQSVMLHERNLEALRKEISGLR